MTKTKLTTSDMQKLEAARGLDLNEKNNQNKSGLRPLVKDYNEAVRLGIYTGDYIIPLGANFIPS